MRKSRTKLGTGGVEKKVEKINIRKTTKDISADARHKAMVPFLRFSNKKVKPPIMSPATTDLINTFFK